MPTLGTVSNYGWALYISSSFNFIILWVRIILIDSSGEKIGLSCNYGINNSFVATMKSNHKIGASGIKRFIHISIANVVQLLR